MLAKYLLVMDNMYLCTYLRAHMWSIDLSKPLGKVIIINVLYNIQFFSNQTLLTFCAVEAENKRSFVFRIFFFTVVSLPGNNLNVHTHTLIYSVIHCLVNLKLFKTLVSKRIQLALFFVFNLHLSFLFY